MNIENLLKVFQYKGSDACFSCQHSTLQPTIDFTLTLSNLFLWSGMMCYILGPREEDSLPGLFSLSVCPPLVRGCDRLMGTLQHYSASSTERLEAGELVMAWHWMDPGLSVPGSLTLRSPRPETCYWSQWSVHPSDASQAFSHKSRKSPACFKLCWIETFMGSKKSLSENIVTPGSTERNLTDHQTHTLTFLWCAWQK